METRNPTYEPYVEQFGEEWRDLIYDALRFLNLKEALWEISEPIDRVVYLQALISARRGQ